MNSIADILATKPPQDMQQLTQTQTAVTPNININEVLNTNTVVESSIALPIQTSDTQIIQQLRTMVYGLKDQLDAMLRMLNGEQVEPTKATREDTTLLTTGERIIEGVFNGHKMIGPDGKEYPVPPNYASKSKLVEGDMLKLTITNNGSFIFKQIGPIKRKRVTGELVSEESVGSWRVLADGRPYKILTASVTFYKGRPGDEVVILVPEDGQSEWGAVEYIIGNK